MQKTLRKSSASPAFTIVLSSRPWCQSSALMCTSVDSSPKVSRSASYVRWRRPPSRRCACLYRCKNHRGKTAAQVGDNRSAPFTRKLTELYTQATRVEELDHTNAPTSSTTVLAVVERLIGGAGADERVRIGLVSVQPSTSDIVYDGVLASIVLACAR